MSERPRFVVRTIRDGAVKINGETFRPCAPHRAYDGRLDGLCFAFGLYYVGREWDSLGGVECWGTEAMYRCQDEAEFARLHAANPAIVEGTFPWSVWRTEAGERRERELRARVGVVHPVSEEASKPSGQEQER